MPDKTLAVALSRSKEDAALLRYAAAAARWIGASRVAFVHVLPASASAAERGRALAGLKGLRTGLPAGVRASYDVLAGPLTDHLLGFAAKNKTEVLLVGHGRKTDGRSALARRLAMKAPCSVWMAPQGARARLRRILVPVDFSGHSTDALRMALALAQRAGAECLPLHIRSNEAALTYEGYDRVLREEETADYRSFLGRINRRGVKVTPLSEDGTNVSAAIGRVADRLEADLVVMATRGRSLSAAILLGSVTEDAIIATRVPLLAVKHFGASLGVLQALLGPRFLEKGRPRAG